VGWAAARQRGQLTCILCVHAQFLPPSSLVSAHARMVLSVLPEKRTPSAPTARATTGAVWPVSVCNGKPSAVDHNRIVQSSEPENKTAPSTPPTDMANTVPAWPNSVRTRVPSSGSHWQITLSHLKKKQTKQSHGAVGTRECASVCVRLSVRAHECERVCVSARVCYVCVCVCVCVCACT
jgi:hypothetical protein